MKKFTVNGLSYIAGLVLLAQLLSCGGGGNSNINDGSDSSGEINEITSTGGTVQSTDDKVIITVPADALTQPTVITTSAISDPSGGGGFSVYEFGPDGTQFNKAVTIAISYDESTLTGGTTEDMLELATFVNGGWTSLADSTVDIVNNTVSATTDHFSVFGLISTINYNWSGNPSQFAALDAETGDFFGSSVDISGDYAIAGAPNEVAIDNNENGQIMDSVYAGAAYIYERQANGSWDTGTKLVNPEGRSINDYFGNAVAIDGSTALVGAFGRQGVNSLDQGAVYVFERQGNGNWQSTAKLTAPDAQANTRFGFSLDLKGDQAIVGMRGNINVGNHAESAAYIFKRAGATWGVPARLLGHGGGDLDLFAWSVGIDGDYAVVGAPYGKGGVNYTLARAGVVYVFHNDGNSWDNGEKLVVLDGQESDDLGRAVAISGQWIIAGAPYKTLGDANGPWPGAVYMFYKPANGSPWEAGQRNLSPVPQSDSWFGGSVDIDGNYAVIGAAQECPSTCQSSLDMEGGVYVFRLASTVVWHWDEKLSMINPAGNNAFGKSVGIDRHKIIVGNELYHDTTGAPGSTYIFERAPN